MSAGWPIRFMVRSDPMKTGCFTQRSGVSGIAHATLPKRLTFRQQSVAI
jgi:hypothetical protein